MNSVLTEDILAFKNDFPFASELKNSSFLITGVSGLIGGLITRCLLSLEQNIHIIAPVRDISKVKSFEGDGDVCFVEGDLLSLDYSILPSVDYVIHCASPTSSKFFVEFPVETSEFILESSIKLLRYCKTNNVKVFLFLSSLEIYGEIDNDQFINEDAQGYLGPLSPRSSYPMAKRTVENLCSLYSKEYGVSTRIARLTQTTGAGVVDSDDRAIVQFVRKAVAGEDIVLHTKGLSARPYLYTIDAVNALMHILLRGSSGEAYNVANDDTYISAAQLADYVRKVINNDIVVRYDVDDSFGYAPASNMRLSTDKLRRLGWKPLYGLKNIILRLEEYMLKNSLYGGLF